ncbi:MAG: ribonuclease J [Eggerthellaceae bacterium]|nr:ribonuclease J [Eggerthellaceae bacterium]
MGSEDKTKKTAPKQGRDKPKKTNSFKHVNIDRQRPHLTRDEPDAGKGKKQASAYAKTAKTRRKVQINSDEKAKLKIIPLGGLDAIGKNMTVLECEGDMILDDAGLMFPDDDHPGIDLILPDYTYVLENSDKLRGIIITHGHEDHTGSLPYLLKDLDREVPIYATKLTLGLIQGKLDEHGIKNARLVEIKPGEEIKLGCFTVDFFAVNHSIPDAVGVFFKCPAGNVLHMGDFKLDQTPIDGVHTDYAALARFGQEGVDLMLSDSTNALNTNFTPSEAEVGKVLNQIVSQAKGRVIVAAFASHIHRMQQICDAAIANGRKVVVTGRSMIQNTDIARKLGYLDIDDSNLIDAYELKDLPPEKVVIMCTGSQGEPLSALSRIANGEHKTIDIDDGDTVIISASPVPGNEKAVTRVINTLAKIGADVYDKTRAPVHVSGHAGAEELKIVLTMVKPKAFMPVHGEASHLRAHALLAQDIGVPEDQIFVLENGDALQLSAAGVEQVEGVDSGNVYVDGLSVGDTSQDVLDERNTLGNQGICSVVAAVSFSQHRILGDVSVEMRGITGGDDESLKLETAASVTSALRRQLARNAGMRELEKTARDAVLSILWERVKQRPMIMINLLEI